VGQKDRAVSTLPRLKAIVTHAYTHSPFYKQHFDAAGFHPRHLRTLGDVQYIPLLTRDDLVAHYDQIVTQPASKKSNSVTFTSAGTIGQKIPITYESKGLELYAAVFGRWLWSVGFRPGERIQCYTYAPTASTEAMDTPAIKAPPSQPTPPAWRALDVCRDYRSTMPTRFYHRMGMVKRGWFDQSFPAELQLQQIRSFQPDWLMGMPSTIRRIAALMRQRGEQPGFAARGIVLGGELLTETTRELIESSFHCRVYNRYSCVELWAMAYECRHGNLHVEDDLVHLEVIKDGLPVFQEHGQLVCTSLIHRHLPLIRYQNGDEGKLSSQSCSCGNTALVLSEIGDYRVRENSLARLWSPVVTLLENSFQRNFVLGEFQLRLAADGHGASLHYERGPRFTASTPQALRQALADFAPELNIEMVENARFDTEMSFKFSPLTVVNPPNCSRMLLH